MRRDSLLAMVASLFSNLARAAALAAGMSGALAVINAIPWRKYRATAQTNGVGPLARNDLPKVPQRGSGTRAAPARMGTAA